MSLLKVFATFGGYSVAVTDSGVVVMQHNGKIIEGESAYELIRGVEDIEARAELLKQWGANK